LRKKKEAEREVREFAEKYPESRLGNENRGRCYGEGWEREDHNDRRSCRDALGEGKKVLVVDVDPEANAIS
jgi:hypothetical protein